MAITGPGGPKQGHTSEVEFTVALTDEGWKIVSIMEPVRAKTNVPGKVPQPTGP